MSVVISDWSSTVWVPRPVTQVPLHGTHTPTIAPVEPVATIAFSTAA